MRACVLALAACLVLGACKESSWRPSSDTVWTEAELKALQGKTRDEIREVLGPPTGLYTIDAKGRWHYPHVKVEGDQPGETEEVTLKIYFSQFGEHRATIIDITRRTGNP